MARYNFPTPTILGNIEPPQLPTDALPNIPATTTTLGGVKVDGTSITIDANGVISASGGGGGGGSFWYGAALGVAPSNDIGDTGEWFVDYLSNDWVPYYKQNGEWKLATAVDKDFSLYPLINRIAFAASTGGAIGGAIDFNDPSTARKDLYDNLAAGIGRKVVVYGETGQVVIIWRTGNPNLIRSAYSLGKPIGGVVLLRNGSQTAWRGHVVGFSIDPANNVTIVSRVDDDASRNAVFNCASLKQDSTQSTQYQGVCDYKDMFADQTMLAGANTANVFMVRSNQDDAWQAGPDVSEFIKGSGTIKTDYDANLKEWTISGGGDLPSLVDMTDRTNSVYTVDGTKTNTSVFVGRQAERNKVIILDSEQKYLPGTRVTILSSTTSRIQIVAAGSTTIDSGSPVPSGRGVKTFDYDSTSGTYKPFSSQVELLHFGDNNWVMKGTMERGAPWLLGVGRPSGEFSPGSVEVTINASGEDFSTLTGITLWAKENTGQGPEVTQLINKQTRSYVWKGLKEGMQYLFGARWNLNEGGKISSLEGWNTIIYSVDSNAPNAPTNIKVVGGRGTRQFITFDYPAIAAPFDSIDARIYNGDTPSTDWIKMAPFKDPFTDQYQLNFWPTNKEAVGTTSVRIRLCNGQIVGDSSASFTVDWEKYMPKINITSIEIDKARKTADVIWDKLSEFDDPNCNIRVQFFDNTGKEVQSSTSKFNDIDVVFNGNSNSDYVVKVTPYTWERMGSFAQQGFRIPSAFRAELPEDTTQNE